MKTGIREQKIISILESRGEMSVSALSEYLGVSVSTLRKQLADELRRATNTDRFDFVASHRGMFSRLGLTEAQVNRLREEHGIYMVGDSRINIAGLNAKTVPILAAAIALVI